MTKIAIRGSACSNHCITKILLSMNFTIVLLTAVFFQVSANGLSQNVSFSGKDVPLTRVFTEVEKQTGYVITYTQSTLDGTHPVSIHIKDAPLEKFLDKVFADQPVKFIIAYKTILLSRKSIALSADRQLNITARNTSFLLPDTLIDVSGNVVGDDGQPVVGASVKVKGIQTGTSTDAAGKFLISVNQKQVLVISSIGYETKEITVGNQTSINVSLVKAVSNLNNVVIVGYGQKTRKMLTESISTVASKEIQKLPVASADAAIQGKVSGVQISNAGGSPGSPASVRIRGVGTVGNTQPLFVIDGIPVGNNSEDAHTNPLSTLNPNDIENISVLKDASSSAIYGMRAANGVVLITTKRGKAGKPKVSLDAYYGIQQFAKKLAVNNTEQYIELAREAIDNQNIQQGLNPGDPGYVTLHPDFTAGTPNSVVGKNIDWQAATINKNAPITNYNLGVSGGTENASYFFSLGNYKQEAITQKWDLERYTMRSNSDFKIGKRLKIGQTLSLTYQEVNRGRSGDGDGFLYQNNISMPTFFDIYDVNNSIPGNRYGFNGNLDVGGLTIGNELALNSIVRVKEKTYRLLGGVYGELELINDLRFRSAASIDMGFGRTTDWSPGFTAAEI
ncbi:MAG: SusC/RagA family TonB-linked outer membrane protein, partial [Ferruginibacter sp.]